MCERTFHFWQEGRTHERKNENISKDSICDGRNCICIYCFAIDILEQNSRKNPTTLQWSGKRGYLVRLDISDFIVLCYIVFAWYDEHCYLFCPYKRNFRECQWKWEENLWKTLPSYCIDESIFNVNVCLFGVLLGDMLSSWKMVPDSVFDSDIFTFYLVYLQEPERDNTKKRAEKGICKTGKGAGRRGGILSD